MANIEYKGYEIGSYPDGSIYFCKGSYDAEYVDDGWKDNATIAESVEDAKEQIDELIDSKK